MRVTGSQLVAEILLEHGVDTVFGYPGGAALNLYDALYEYRDKIRHILTAHEQGAAHAADGYYRATGKTGVVFATSGPGATNLVTGIATAFMDSIPMIAITANVPDSLIGRDAFQEICITGVAMPITKHTFFVNRIEDLADALENGEIAAAGLDVLRVEPMLADNPLGWIKDSKKLLITPHIAWASVEARTRLMDIILGQIKEFFDIK